MKVVLKTKEQHNLLLCKLKGEEFLRTRALYEEVFREDSRRFVDYYYETKSQNSTALVLQKENGEIVSMLHLNPYEISVRDGESFQSIQACYIVAVATKENYRHQGCMARLLKEAELFCQENSVSFLFLMPADPAIYSPFGYEYIFSRPEFYFSEEMKEGQAGEAGQAGQVPGDSVKFPLELRVERILSENLCRELAEFAQSTLESRFAFFTRRSKEYYVNLSKELQAQNGEVGIYYLDKKIVGYYTKTGEAPNMFCGADCICEALFTEEFTELCKQYGRLPISKTGETHPIIMGKIPDISHAAEGTESKAESETIYETLTTSEKGWLIEIV